MLKKEIRILTFGGGIAFSNKSGTPVISDIGGMMASLSNGLNSFNIRTIAFHRTPSSAMMIDDIIALVFEIKKLVVEEKVSGIVVVQGTDTIEETAFILNTLIDFPIPIVVTGAARTPDLHSPDGPANLLSSVQVAGSDCCRGLGTVVVFNDMIFPGDFVRNIHTHLPNAFGAECGPLGFVVEGTPSLRVRPIRRKIPNLELKNAVIETVPIYSVPLGDDGRLLSMITKVGYKGVVLEALGGGHVPTSVAYTLEKLAKEIPVILSSRVGFGDMLTSSYSGYPGSETYLLSHGLISSGMLDGRKARILLILLLTCGFTREQIIESFRIYSRHHHPC